MTLSALLETLTQASARLRRDGEELVITFGAVALDDSTLNALREHKPALLQFLDDQGGEWEAPSVRTEQHRELSFGQQRLWFLDQLQPGSAAYNEEFCVRLVGKIDVTILERSLNEIVRRHDILRTTFGNVDGRPMLNVAESMRVPVHRHDLNNLPADERERIALELAGALVLQPFDLAAGPLIRSSLIRLDEENHLLQVCMHHIVTDGWSMRVLAGELVALYRSFAARQGNTLPALAIQYADYAAWQNAQLKSELAQKQSRFWQQTMQGAPLLLNVPADRARPNVQAYAGAFVEVMADLPLTATLRQFSRDHGVTLFMTVLAAWAALLARLSGQNDVVVGSPVANRGRPELEPLIGFIANALPLRIDLSGSPCAVELVQRVKAVLVAAHEHQDLPFDKIVEAANPPRTMSHSPLFQVMLNWQSDVTGGAELEGVTLHSVCTPYNIAKYDLTLRVVEEKHRLMMRLEYATALFDQGTIERYSRYFTRLLRAMVEDERTAVDRLLLLSETERQQLLYKWNATMADYAEDKRVHELFEAQAAMHPERIAVVDGNQKLSYADLNAQANRLAHHLREAGAVQDARVAICMERGADMVMVLLAILKSGAAYVPLDPAHPVERIAYMLADSGACIVVSHSRVNNSVRSMLQAATVPLVAVDTDVASWADEPDTDRIEEGAGRLAHSLAYVIYTSGSTGRPKGVMVEHRGVVNLLQAMKNVVPIGMDDQVLALTTIAFDIAALEIYLPLICGAQVVLCGREETSDPNALGKLIDRHAITLMQATPATWRMLLEAGWAGNKRLHALCGGEPLPVELARRIAEKVGRLWNVYGPTETTIWSACMAFEPDASSVDQPYVSIGKPLANTQIYLLDPYGEPVPVGVTGEIHIAGAGVARSYLNRPALNAERFVANRFLDSNSRMYRTGDLGRYLPNGNIEFLGRSDSQVKLRGFRVELGEIEACLASHPYVREAAVLAQGAGDEDKYLVAYYTASCVGKTEPAALRTHLVSMLPDYMVPAAYVPVDAMPLTPNGKLDRKALPMPDDAAFGTRSHVPPLDDIETALARIWTSLLGKVRISRLDHFFEIGGHSLLAIRLISKIRDVFGVELQVTHVFERPILAEMAESVRTAARRELPPIVPVPRTEGIALSFAQQRLWFLSQMAHVSKAYHMAFGLKLLGTLDREVLQSALDQLAERHEALRTAFVSIDGQPFQWILTADTPFPLKYHDIRGAADTDAGLQGLIRDEIRTPFNLEHGRLCRAQLIRLGETEYVLLCTMHHIISDGWSIGILVREFSALYSALSQGEPNPLPPLAIQYADYAMWQRRWGNPELLESDSAHWTEVLSGAPERLDIPSDRPRPVQQDYAGAYVEIALSTQLTHDLKGLSQRHGVTLFMTLLAGWAVLLARLSGAEDLVIGTPTANRTRSEAEPLVGFLVNALALRLDLSGEPDVGALLQRVKKRSLEAQEHQAMPFEHLVETMSPARSLDRHPIFQATFTWQNNDEGRVELPGLEVQPFPVPRLTTKFDVSLYLAEEGGRIIGGIEYATALFDSTTVDRYAGYLCNILHAMAADDRQGIFRIAFLDAEERERLLHRRVCASDAYHVDNCVHELFEKQAERTPHAIALVHGETAVTYDALNARANQLAHYLRRHGVAPDVHVGLCVERGIDMITGILAIHKAGGAYVPLDPAYPIERLHYMLADSEPIVVITHAEVEGRVHALLQDSAKAVIDLQTHASTWQGEPEANLECARTGLCANNLAYVMYTSGSTGKPKGVMVEHRNLARLFAATCNWFGFAADDVWTLFHSFSFDFSVWEMWGALAHGGRLVIVSRDVARSPQQFYKLLCKERVTVLNHTPSAFRQLIAAQQQTPSKHCLRTVIFGGEALEPAMLKPWYEQERNRETRLVNMYGITETTVHVTYRPMSEADAQTGHGSPIGVPIPDLSLYILDRHGEPVPAGVAGEMYVGGAGVARGYLNQQELTKLRFLPDPFAGASGERMYRTGDLARRFADGSTEYLGRNDMQVKLRGFRIELGEIEARLAEHPAVREAAVIAKESGPDDKRLIAYYTPQARVSHEDAVRLGSEHVAQWARLYDQTYDDKSSVESQPGFNFVGWNSSYTRSPISTVEMHDWLESVLRRIRSLKPRRVLEIGCGSGMILYHIAPECECYVGTDLSRKTIEQLDDQTRRNPVLLANTMLLHAQAADFSTIPDKNYDTVVLNSVVQYFPNSEYLFDVLSTAVKTIKSSGKIFVGDVRHHGLLEAFHLSILLAQPESDMPLAQLSARMRQRVQSEQELVIDPAWFFALQGKIPEISHVQVLPKDSVHQNEMSAFRYDVVLTVGASPEMAGQVEWIDCKRAHLRGEDIRRQILNSPCDVVGLKGIFNPRVGSASLALTQLPKLSQSRLCRDLIEQAKPEDGLGMTCNELTAFCSTHGFLVSFSWFPVAKSGEYHAVVSKNGVLAEIDWRQFGQDGVPDSEPASLANDPLYSKKIETLPSELRAHLASTLPDYMVPAAYFALDRLPLTLNGKLDRQVLLENNNDVSSTTAYEAPLGEIEKELAAIWADLLKVQRVGRTDDFFALGGHSLLGTKLIARIVQQTGVEISIQDLFTRPTLSALADRVVSLLLEELTPEELEDAAKPVQL
jgi:amino acid adenylation domain-containing protein